MFSFSAFLHVKEVRRLDFSAGGMLCLLCRNTLYVTVKTRKEVSSENNLKP